MDGVFFEPPMFEYEKPDSKQAEGHVMVPPDPRAHLVVVEARVAFPRCEELLDSMAMACDTHQDFFVYRRLFRAEEVPRLGSVNRDEKNFLARTSAASPSLDASAVCDDVDRALLPVRYRNSLPSLGCETLCTLRDRAPFRTPPRPVGRAQNSGGTRDLKEVPLPTLCQNISELARSTEFVVPHDPGMR